MDFTTIWNQLIRKRPTLTNPHATVEISAANLRILLEQVHAQGRKHEEKTAPFKSVFDSMTGSN